MSEWHEEPQTARAVAAKLATDAEMPLTVARAQIWAMIALADAIYSSVQTLAQATARGPFSPASLRTYNPDGSIAE